MRKVAFLTPALDGKVNCEYAISLSNSIIACASRGIELIPIMVSCDALIQRARNDLMTLIHDSDISDAIFCDSDQEWSPEDLLKLLKYDVDVVGGAVVKKSDYESYNIKAKEEMFVKDKAGLMQVECIGTGFLRMSKKAIDFLWDSSKEYTENKISKRWIYDVILENGELLSEDIVVSDKLRDGGFDINLDPTITCSHIGLKKWSGNFEALVNKLKDQARENEPTIINDKSDNVIQSDLPLDVK